MGAVQSFLSCLTNPDVDGRVICDKDGTYSPTEYIAGLIACYRVWHTLFTIHLAECRLDISRYCQPNQGHHPRRWNHGACKTLTTC